MRSGARRMANGIQTSLCDPRGHTPAVYAPCPLSKLTLPEAEPRKSALSRRIHVLYRCVSVVDMVRLSMPVLTRDLNASFPSIAM